MIVSHRYKFIFIKTGKTAGTSVEIALSRFCGPDDIITPVSPDDERTRVDLGYRGAQNCPPAPLWQYGLRDVVQLVRSRERKYQFFNHMSGAEVKARVGKEVWDGYFKFCIERNPWDRMISLYYWIHQTEPRPTISEFLDSKASLMLSRQGIQLYSIDGQVAVDEICRFENLTDDLEAIRLKLGIPEELTLPRAKSQFRKKRGYRDSFSEEDRSKVAEMFADEIRLLGYEF